MMSTSYNEHVEYILSSTSYKKPLKTLVKNARTLKKERTFKMFISAQVPSVVQVFQVENEQMFDLLDILY